MPLPIPYLTPIPPSIRTVADIATQEQAESVQRRLDEDLAAFIQWKGPHYRHKARIKR